MLYLRYIDGLAYEEVAALVGCTAAAARKAAQRGRTRLAGLVREEEK